MGTLAALSLVTWLVLNLVMSLANSPDAGQSLKMLSWITINAAMLFTVAYWRTNRTQLVSDGLAAASIVATVAIVGWLASNTTGRINLLVEDDYGSDSFRASGFMLEPNLLASYCLIWLCLAFIHRESISKRKLLLTSISLIGAILATYTRASLLVIIALIVVWLIKSKKLSLYFFAFIGCLSLILLLPDQLVDSESANGEVANAFLGRLEGLLDLESGTGNFRVATSDIAWSEIQNTGYWHGHGLNSFPLLHASEITSTGQLYLGFLWLALWYDAGVLGMLFFILAFGLYWILSGKSSWPVFIAITLVSITTSPIWYAYPWVLSVLACSYPIGRSQLKKKFVKIETRSE